MKISVTNENIRDGEAGSYDACPIALAIKSCTRYKSVYVGSLYARLGKKKYRLPEIAENFIYVFDEGCDVEPFEFELRREL